MAAENWAKVLDIVKSNGIKLSAFIKKNSNQDYLEITLNRTS